MFDRDPNPRPNPLRETPQEPQTSSMTAPEKSAPIPEAAAPAEGAAEVVNPSAQDPAQPQAPYRPPVQNPLQFQAPYRPPVQNPLQPQAPYRPPVQNPLQSQAPYRPPVQNPLQSQAPYRPPVQDPLQSQAPYRPPVQDQVPFQAPFQPAVPQMQPMPAAPYPRPLRPMPQPRPVRAPYALNKADVATVVLLIVLDVFGVITALWGGFRAGFTLTYCLFFITLSAYFKSQNARVTPFTATCGILSLALSASFVLTANEGVLFFSLNLMIVLSILWYASLSGKTVPNTEWGAIRAAFIPVGHTFRDLPLSMKSLFSSGGQKKRVFPKVLLGILVTLPVLLILVPLLIESDPAFQGLMAKLFSDLETTIFQILVALILLPFLLAFVLSLKKEQDRPAKPGKFRGFDAPVFIAVLGVFTLLYLVYLISQLAYFFSAFKSILPPDFDLTYAAYARRGFFEMAAISGINFVVLYTVTLLARKNENGKLPVSLRILGSFLVLVNLVLIGTAFSKMVLYIRYYGLTVSRVATSLFMIALAAMFLLMLIRLFVKKLRLAPAALIIAGVLLLVMGLGNMEGVVARYNYDAYQNGTLKKIDVNYLDRIGEEGLPYLVKLTKDPDPEVAREAKRALEFSFGTYYHCPYSDIPAKAERRFDKYSEFTLPRYRAYEAFETYMKENPDFANSPYAPTYTIGRSDKSYQ